MGTYRLWPSTNGPAAPAGDATAYTLGVEFYVTALVNFTGFWWWCAPGASTSPKSFELWQVVTATSGNPVAGTTATSSTLTQGAWNYTALSSPVALATNQRYRAGVLGAGPGNWYAATANGWPADITNGPLTAPSSAHAIGGNQSSYALASVLTFPSQSSGSNYWLDVQVTNAAAPPTSAITSAKGREAATFASGQQLTALVKGREPVFSTGGEHP